MEQITKRGMVVSGLSTVIITYILGEGEFTGQANMYMGAVKFHNPGAVIVIFLLVHFYTAYRLYLPQENQWRLFKKIIREKLSGDKRVRAVVMNLAKKNLKKDVIRQGIENKGYSMNNILPHWDHSQNQGFRESLIRKEACIKLKISVDNRRKVDGFHVNIGYLFFWKHFFKHSFFYEDFWSLIFPWILFHLSWALLLIDFIFPINWGCLFP